MLSPRKENISWPQDIIDQFKDKTDIIRVVVKQKLQKLEYTADFIFIFCSCK